MLLIIAGAFTPVTMEGNIMVDGILASCFASTDHDIAMPIRWFPTKMAWIFGVENECAFHAKFLEEVARWILPHGQLY